MTTSEIKYTDYVSSFVGVPYVWKGHDKEQGMDCRIMLSEFLTGLGYDFDGEDGEPIPTKEELDQILQDKVKTRSLCRRYIRGVKSKGRQVDIHDLRQNDIVIYPDDDFIHVGVYTGDNKILTTSKDHGSYLIRLDKIRDTIITIVRLEK